MTNALSLLTFRAWLKPGDTAPQLVQCFNLNIVVVFYTIYTCITIAIAWIQADAPPHFSLFSYVFAPTMFVLLARWAIKLPWLVLLKIVLLGLIVTIPLNFLPGITITFISTYESGESSLVLFSILALLYFLLPIWTFTIQLRLYSKMLRIRKRIASVIIVATVATTTGVNLFLFQLMSQV